MTIDDRALIQREVHPGERLLWSGMPRSGIRVERSDLVAVPFSLVWGGFALFWNVAVWASDAPLLFRLSGLPFLLIGVYITVGRFVVDAYRRSRTVYAVTDQRAIIVSRAFGQDVTSVWVSGMSDIRLDGGNRTGTITLASKGLSSRGWPGSNANRPIAFEAIPDAREVYDALMQLRIEVAGQGTMRRPQSGDA